MKFWEEYLPLCKWFHLYREISGTYK